MCGDLPAPQRLSESTPMWGLLLESSLCQDLQYTAGLCDCVLENDPRVAHLPIPVVRVNRRGIIRPSCGRKAFQISRGIVVHPDRIGQGAQQHLSVPRLAVVHEK